MRALSTGAIGDENASLVVIYKGLNYNKRDNDEVKFLRGLKGASHAAEVFGPSGVWVYNFLLDFLKIPAGGMSLGELLDSAIKRKNAPNDKAKCLAEIGQFWEKLSSRARGPQKQQKPLTDNQVPENTKKQEAKPQKALQEMNAEGDDRDLSTHGSDRGYWYSIRDGMSLLVAVRKAKLSYSQAVYNEYTENEEDIFIANPYHELNFEESLLGDIERIIGDHGIQAWVQRPNILIIPVLSGLHWRCIRIEINYNTKQGSILFDDPYGKGRFDERLKDRIRNSIKEQLPKLLMVEGEEISYVEVEKSVNQQGDDNGSDCGPIVFGNVEDYCDASKANRSFTTKDGFTIVSEASDSGHNKTMEDLRFRHITEFREVAGLPINEDHLKGIREAIKQSNNKKKSSFPSNDAETICQIEVLPAEYVSHIFNAVDLGISLKEAYESIMAEKQVYDIQKVASSKDYMSSRGTSKAKEGQSINLESVHFEKRGNIDKKIGQQGLNTLQAKLRNNYLENKHLPKLLEDDKFAKQDIESTYVNLMLIEREKEKDDTHKEEKNGKKAQEGKTYGPYEEIAAPKREIELESIFNNRDTDRKEKEVNKILIYGKAGIGKTTLCNYISYKWAKPASSRNQQALWQDKFDYVFWLPLRNLSGDWHTQHQADIGEYALECFIKRYCLDRDRSFSVKDIAEVIEKGKVLLILDGYDEVASLHNEKHIVVKDVIDSAIKIKNPKAKVVMTSRPNAIGPTLRAKFDAEIENIGLKVDNVYEYVDKYKFREKGKSEGLKALLKQHGQIESVAQVPINLYLLCLIWDKEGLKNQENITVTVLYEEVVGWLMKRYLSKFKEKKLVEINYNGIEEGCIEESTLLEKIAYCGVRSKTAILRSEECKWSGVDWSKLSALKALGILSGKGVEEATREYEFIHLTFQEYFAARHIVKLLGSKNLEEVKEAVKFLNENKYTRVYERVILFVSGLVVSELEKRKQDIALKRFWDVIINGSVDLTIGRQLGLVIRSLEEGRCHGEIPGVDKLLDAITQHSINGFNQIKQSLNESVRVVQGKVARSFINRLKDRDKPVRRGAVVALDGLKLEDEKLKEEAAKALLEALKDSDWFVPITAAQALGKLKLEDKELIKEVVRTSIEALKNKNKSVSGYLVEALVQFKLEEAELKEVVRVLVQSLRDKSEYAPLDAIQALVKLKLDNVALMEEIAKALFDAIKDKNKEVQSAAVKALGELKVNNVKLVQEIAKTLFEGLEYFDQYVRIHAAEVLKKLGLDNIEITEEIAKYSLKALNDPISFVYDVAQKALTKFKPKNAELSKEIAEILLEILNKNHNQKACYVAVEILCKLKPKDKELEEQIIESLLKMLNSPNMSYQVFRALKHLGLECGELEIAKTLLQGIQDHDTHVATSVSLLGQRIISDPELEERGLEALLEALKNKSEKVRSASAKALGEKLKDINPAKRVFFINELEDAKTSIYWSAARVLVESELEYLKLEKKIAEALIQVLKDQESIVRKAATKSLGKFKLGNARPTEERVEYLLNKLPSTCTIATKILHKLNLDDKGLKNQIVKSLSKIIDDSNAGDTAVEILDKLKPKNVELIKRVAKTLFEMLKDPSPQIKADIELKLEPEDASLVADLVEAVSLSWPRYNLLETLKLENSILKEKVLKALFEAFEDKDEEVRIAAAKALVKSKLGDIGQVVEASIHGLKNQDKEIRIAAISTFAKLRLEDIALKEKVVKALLEALRDPEKDVQEAVTKILCDFRLEDVELKEELVKIFLEVFKSKDEYVRRVAAKILGKLKLKDKELEKKLVKDLLDARVIDVLGDLQIKSKEIQLETAELLLRTIPLNVDYAYLNSLNTILVRCAINGIKLSFKAHSINLLEFKIFRESAIVISYGCMTLHYGDHKLVFEFDPTDKELPLKVWEHFRQRAEEAGLPLEMLDSIRTGRKWIEIEGIDPEIDKVIRNNIIGGLDMREIIARELELELGIKEQDRDACTGDLLQVCQGLKQVSWLVEKYKGQKQSPILVIALQMAVPDPENLEKMKGIHGYVKILRNVIKELSRQGIGMKFVDKKGNRVGHYAVRHWYRDLEDLILQDGLFKAANHCTATIMHTAVFYGCVDGVYGGIREQNLNFTQKAKFGRWDLNPLELAVALGDTKVIKKIFDITKQVPSTDLCGGNILSLAIELGRHEVLHHLLCGYQMEAKLVQEAFIFAGVVGNKGSIEALRTVLGSFQKYSSCSTQGYNSAGNTVLHEVVEKQGMKKRDKVPIINYLLSQDKKLLDTFNSKADKKLPRDLAAKQALRDYLDGKKGKEDSKQYEMPKIWETPIRNVVFKGGGPKGVVYIGALKGLEKIQKEKALGEIERVAGTSAGAITAGLYAIGYTGGELEKDLANINIMSFLDHQDIEKMLKIYRSDTGLLKKITSLKQRSAGGDRLIFEIINSLGREGGLCLGEKFEEIVGELIRKKTGDKNFTLGDLNTAIGSGKGFKKLCVVTLNINQENRDNLIVLSSDNPNHRNIRLVDAIRASMAIPIVFTPKEISYFDMETGNEVKLRCIDGGMVYNYPLDIFDMAKYQGAKANSSQKPVYNEYTLGFSIYSEEVSDKLKSETEAKEKEGIYGKMMDMLIWIAGGKSVEVRENTASTISHIKGIIEVLMNGELVRNEYWKVSDDNRTVKINCLGVGLLDFDLSPTKVEELIEEGERSIDEAFDPDRVIEVKQKAPALPATIPTTGIDPHLTSTTPAPYITTRGVIIAGSVAVAAVGAVYYVKTRQNDDKECVLL